MTLAIPCLALLLSFIPEDDKIWMKDGKVLQGQITDRKTAYVEIDVAGKKQRVTREKIDKITDAADHVRFVDATETKTPHYSIFSNAPKPDIDTLTQKLEMFYAWFFANYQKELKLHSMKRLGVKFFDLRTEYLDAAKGLSRGGTTPQGFYSFSDETLYACKQPIDGFDKPDHTLYHEAGHEILHLCANMEAGGGVTSDHHWVHEAMACTFEGLHVENGKLVQGLSDQRIRNLHIRMAEGSALRTLSVLDTLDKSKYLAPEYDQGYALALFFLTSNGGKWKKPFLDYYQDIAFTRVRDNTFEKLFGRKIDTFEKEWREFVLALKPVEKAAH